VETKHVSTAPITLGYFPLKGGCYLCLSGSRRGPRDNLGNHAVIIAGSQSRPRWDLVLSY